LEELISEIKRHSLDERVLLLEALSKSAREDLVPNKGQAVSRKSRILELQGLLKPDGPEPTDEQIKEAHTDYLIEKYLNLP
jgi:hypothetical protein